MHLEPASANRGTFSWTCRLFGFGPRLLIATLANLFSFVIDRKSQKGPMSAPRSSPSGRKRSSTIAMDIDPNEPLYCFCQQVSFGDMVGCDNDSVNLRWFDHIAKERFFFCFFPLTRLLYCSSPIFSATRSGSTMVVLVWQNPRSESGTAPLALPT